MCPGSRVWWRALAGALLLSLGASLELYDQPGVPGDASEDLLYQDANDIDTGPDERPLPRAGDTLIHKIIRALQRQATTDDRHSYRLSRLPYEANARRFDQRTPEETQFKDPVYKRLSEVFGSHHSLKPSEYRPQKKWKIKKGKAIGSQMVCYFKLCAFRSPA